MYKIANEDLEKKIDFCLLFLNQGLERSDSDLFFLEKIDLAKLKIDSEGVLYIL